MNTAIKQCFKCGLILPLSDFYRHAAMGDGYLNKCKECTKTDVRANRRKRADYYREYDQNRAMRPDRVEARKEYAQTDAGKAANRKAKRRYIAKNPEKRAAHVMVGNAVRDGRLQKAPCMICGDPRSHGHHDNYARPLDVVWLCAEHHAERHRSLDSI